MHEIISYGDKKMEQIATNPHILLFPSKDIIGFWGVGIIWREDKPGMGIDAELSLIDGMNYKSALRGAITCGESLNLPVAEYNDQDLELFFQPSQETTPEQKIKLQRLIESDKIQKFRTH